MAVEIPHFANPFVFVLQPDATLAASVTEQDTTDEIVDCVERITSFIRGQRDELPGFGISDPTFEQTPIDTRLLATEVGEWEDRVDLSAVAGRDTLDELTQDVRLMLEPTGEGGA